MSQIRIRRLSRSEMRDIQIKAPATYLVPLYQPGYEQPVAFGILEQNTQSEPDRDPQWSPVEIT